MAFTEEDLIETRAAGAEAFNAAMRIVEAVEADGAVPAKQTADLAMAQVLMLRALFSEQLVATNKLIALEASIAEHAKILRDLVETKSQ